MKEPARFGRLSRRYTTRSCVRPLPRWWRAWNYPSATPPPFVAGDASRWSASRQCRRPTGGAGRRGDSVGDAACGLVGHGLIGQVGERRIQRRVLLRRSLGGARGAMSGWIPSGATLLCSGVNHRLMVIRTPPSFSRRLQTWTVFLPNDRLADDGRTPALLQRRRHDLRRRGRPPVDEDHHRQVRVGRHAVTGRASTRACRRRRTPG